MTATLTRPRAKLPRGKRSTLPIDQTAAGYTANRREPVREEWSGPALRIYDEAIARAYDAWRIEASVFKNEAWWIAFFTREKVPADTYRPILADLTDWILIEQLSRLADPDAFDVVDDEPTVDADAEGLTVRPLTRREKRPKPILPGCERLTMIGGDEACPRLRRPTERLCPACAAQYLKTQRQQRR